MRMIFYFRIRRTPGEPDGLPHLPKLILHASLRYREVDGGRRDSKKLAELPLRLATTTQFVNAVTEPAWRVKAAVVAPAATVTDVGMRTETEPVATPNDTDTGLKAADAKVTVQVEESGVTRLAGLHDNLDIGGAIVRVAVLPAAATLPAVGEATTTLAI
jgi:hypothetical protein